MQFNTPSHACSGFTATAILTFWKRKLHNFYRWAVQDERIVGMAPWNWGGCGLCTSTKDEIGTVDLVESKAAWVAIGKA